MNAEAYDERNSKRNVSVCVLYFALSNFDDMKFFVYIGCQFQRTF